MVETDPDVKSHTEAPMSKIEFDVDEYIKPYKGRPALLRLLHIIQTSDSTAIRTRACELARTEVEALTDARLYASTISLIATASGTVLQPDQQRLRELQMEARELIRTPEAIAFRIRHRRLGEVGALFETVGSQNIAYLALAQAYERIGQTSEAYAFYRRVNEECHDWTPEMATQKWLGILMIYLVYGIVRDDSRRGTCPLVSSVLFDCDAGLRWAQKRGNDKIPQKEIDSTIAPVIAAHRLLKALTFFTNGRFDLAAQLFFALGDILCEEIEAVMAPKDLAILTALCGLATTPPFDIPCSIAEHEVWGPLLHRSPCVLRLLKASLCGDADAAVQYFESTSDFLLLDPFLCQQAQPLAEAIVKNVLLWKATGTLSV